MEKKTTRFDQVPVQVAEKALRLQPHNPHTFADSRPLAGTSHRRRGGTKRVVRRNYLQLIRRRIN